MEQGKIEEGWGKGYSFRSPKATLETQVTFEQGSERGEGMSHVAIFERRYQAEGTARTEVLR